MQAEKHHKYFAFFQNNKMQDGEGGRWKLSYAKMCPPGDRDMASSLKYIIDGKGLDIEQPRTHGETQNDPLLLCLFSACS